MENTKHISTLIKSKAIELGFFNCGITKACHLKEDAVRLKNWLDKRKHGEMIYMKNHFEKRTDPSKLFDNAKSVIVVLMNYYPSEKLHSENYQISKYAYGTDYHFVVKEKLKELIRFINSRIPALRARAFVDSAPLLERSLARNAGLGWIGKNTNLITKEQGSYFFIGEILTDLELEYNDTIVSNHCGGCTKCLNACPTNALDDTGLDANKCISYWTIEYRGENIPASFRDKFGKWIFGCDICQDVCPWNRLSEPHSENRFKLSDHLKSMSDVDWRNLNPAEFNLLFKDSPVKRTKYKGLKRNIEFVEKKDKKV